MTRNFVHCNRPRLGISSTEIYYHPSKCSLAFTYSPLSLLDIWDFSYSVTINEKNSFFILRRKTSCSQQDIIIIKNHELSYISSFNTLTHYSCMQKIPLHKEEKPILSCVKTPLLFRRKPQLKCIKLSTIKYISRL